ncbi:MAG: hypothetical protein K8R60_05295 [Burkholderiales bacterium]|nr:hypothetical protein [Burkholderiales bacterium]
MRWLRLARTLAAALAFAGGAVAAAPGYYVVTVYDNPGIRTADFRYWTVKFPDRPVVTWPEVGFGWNITGQWYSELLLSYVGGSDLSSQKLETLNWQNDYLLTQGQYPFDFAIHTQLVRPQHPASGYVLEIGPVLQTDIGRTQVNFNVFLDHPMGAIASNPTELRYQWQLRYRWTRWLHVGAQGFGELGPWDDWLPHEQQSHRAGPALFGSIPGGPGTFGWQMSYLFGKTYGQRSDMFSMRLKYEF